MSHFSWQLATCFQERVFLSAEQPSLRCSPRTHGQEDGAGDAVRLVSLICHLSCPLVPPLCHVPTTVAGRMSFQAKHIHVLAAGLLSCKQMLARACSAHGEPAVGCGAQGLCSSERREKKLRALISATSLPHHQHKLPKLSESLIKL